MSPTIIPQDKVVQFILAGKATVIFHNTKTGNVFKFRINKHQHHSLWYVNSADKIINKTIGVLYSNLTFKVNDREELADFQQHIKVWEWMWKHIMNKTVPSYIEILHTGACAACNKPLTDPLSISVGFGPECRKRLGITITSSLIQQ